MLRTAILSLTLLASPAFAQSHYRAEPAAKPAVTKIVLRDTIWSCGDSGCSAGKSGSRPAIVCEVLAREVGALRSFSVAGQPIAPEQLEKCNARAN
ncbi:MAG TPA: hypothetical protein VF662_03800 [Allosphingosinicella sp.]|jgi:hypothetical protein